jgi:hypothetical protein
MSAKIYTVPTEFEKVPNIFDHLDDQSKYRELEEQWYEGLKQWCKKRNPDEDQNYIGERIQFPMADSFAEYMVSALEDEDGEVELLHLPVMDAWDYADADLMTAKRVMSKIDTRKRMNALFS